MENMPVVSLDLHSACIYVLRESAPGGGAPWWSDTSSVCPPSPDTGHTAPSAEGGRQRRCHLVIQNSRTQSGQQL